MTTGTVLAERFNSQPPEGGWKICGMHKAGMIRFNSQPPEGGWFCHSSIFSRALSVSTHSRPKAAGFNFS